MSSANRANQEAIIKLLGGNVSGDQDNSVFVTNLDPLSGYKFTDGDEGATSYFGFLNKDGKWFIQRLTQTPFESRYVFGDGGYSIAWINRVSLTYQIFSEAI